DDCGLVRRKLARRLGKPRFAAGETWTFRRKIDLELVLARDGAQAPCHCALERLGGRVLRRALAFDVRGHGALDSRRVRRGRMLSQLSATLTELSGSSAPKQR